MQLLEPKQNREAKANIALRDGIRLKEVNEELSKAHKRRESAELDFTKLMDRQREVWAQEESDHKTALKALVVETKGLEERRSRALLPVAEEQARADEGLQQAHDRFAEAEALVTETEERRVLLEEKLDSLGERESDMQAREIRAQAIEAENTRKSEELEANRTTLEATRDAFSTSRTLFLAEADTRDRALRLAEINIGARTAMLEDRELKADERERVLEDQRQTLERALNRTKKK